MAIGFSLSSVHEILIDPDEQAIYFELKNIRYKIVIDNVEMAEKVIAVIDKIIQQKTEEKKPNKPLPSFYKDGGA